MAAAALKNRIENLIAMAQLLERVDANPTLVGAQQYLNLVNTVKGLLAEDDLPDDALFCAPAPPARRCTRTCTTTAPGCRSRRWTPRSLPRWPPPS